MPVSTDQIVFFDGECGFCNRAVQFILRYEKDTDLIFASIQSDFTKHFLADKGFPPPQLDTMYYFNGSELFVKSGAVLEISRHLRFPLGALYFFKWIPGCIRDSMYNLVSRNRNRLGPQKCFVPSESQRPRFRGIT